MPRSGSLKQRITIQERAINNVLGDPIEVWSDVQEMWAKVQPMRGDELFKAQQMNTRINTKITMRPYPGLSTLHRIIHGSDTYNILSVQNVDSLGVDMLLYCEEVRTSGS
ncbi:MAG: phage head closure protein [Sphaerochaeta sp.]|jgi:SPP1 family predicted phage head-tail adaptor|nr:phage head closure protein [Sphaerochaeta sp.]